MTAHSFFKDNYDLRCQVLYEIIILGSNYFMKFLLLLSFLLYACTVSAQDKFELGVEYVSSDTLGTGVGGHFSMSRVLSGKFSVGGSLSAVKFENLQSLYYPVSFKFKFHPLSKGSLKPFLLAEAGYGIYSHTENFSTTNRYSSKGGFTYFGGAGLSLRLVNVHPAFTIGYSAFTVRTTHSTQSIGVEYVSKTADAFGGLRARLSIGF